MGFLLCDAWGGSIIRANRNLVRGRVCFRRSIMTPDERERMTALCRRIAEEQDHQEFMELLEALNDLLEGKGQRLEKPTKPKPS